MTHVTAFHRGQQIASGARDDVARTIGKMLSDHDGAILVFDDSSGRIVDLDFHNVVPRASGRPKLGVQAREVTLLPRHWEWLAQQSSGASATLRKLIDEAAAKGKTVRECRDAAYRFMQATSGDMPNYEDALRALYAGQDAEFQSLIAQWPDDIVRYVNRLLGGPLPEAH